MIDDPQIIETTAKATAIIRLTVAKSEMGKIFGPGIVELMTELAAQGIQPTGPVFAHHLKITPEKFDFELSVPVSAPVKSAGRVQPSEWPSMVVARTVYHGPYEGLPAAWGEFMDWIEAGGHTPAEDLWECYITNPDSDPDPANWRTELNREIVD
jgi:effector-binding domain-containing protein